MRLPAPTPKPKPKSKSKPTPTPTPPPERLTQEQVNNYVSILKDNIKQYAAKKDLSARDIRILLNHAQQLIGYESTDWKVAAVSKHGAVGLGQITTDAVNQYNKDFKTKLTKKDTLDPENALRVAGYTLVNNAATAINLLHRIEKSKWTGYPNLKKFLAFHPLARQKIMLTAYNAGGEGSVLFFEDKDKFKTKYVDTHPFFKNKTEEEKQDRVKEVGDYYGKLNAHRSRYDQAPKELPAKVNLPRMPERKPSSLPGPELLPTPYSAYIDALAAPSETNFDIKSFDLLRESEQSREPKLKALPSRLQPAFSDSESSEPNTASMADLASIYPATEPQQSSNEDKEFAAIVNRARGKRQSTQAAPLEYDDELESKLRERIRERAAVKTP